MATSVFATIDVNTQLAMASTVPSKTVHRYGLAELNNHMNNRRIQAMLQCDDETSISKTKKLVKKFRIKYITSRNQLRH